MESKFAGSAYRHFLIWGILSSLATTVCTIVDAALVGNLIGAEGLAVANISTPVFLLYALLGTTVGIGANVQIGRLLGASEVKKANRLFHAQLCLGLLVGGLSLLPLLFQDAYFSFLGVTEELYPLARRYLTVVMWSAPIFVMYHILCASVRTDSDPRCSALASGAVIVTNIALDLIFMKGLNWGILGASASLCIAEAVGVVILLTHFLKKNSLLKPGLALPAAKESWAFVSNGFGIGSANIFGAVVMLVFNTLLLRGSDSRGATYVAIYGVIYTISTIPAGVFDGASTALSAVTTFFVGESDREGVFAALKKALTVALIGGGLLAVPWALFPETLLRVFGMGDEAVAQGSTAMAVFALSLVFSGVNTVATAFWQSIGRAKPASAMSVIRNCLLLLAMGALLIPRGDISGLALSYVITELICTLIVVGVWIFRPSGRYMAEKYPQTEKSFERTYPIATESMSRISEDLERICEEWEMGPKQAFAVNFICEELLLNVIKFGLNDAKRAPNCYISLKLMQRPEGYVLRMRDNVRSYNPFASSGDEIDTGVLKLIQKKTKYLDYQRKMVFNYLYMVI